MPAGVLFGIFFVDQRFSNVTIVSTLKNFMANQPTTSPNVPPLRNKGLIAGLIIMGILATPPQSYPPKEIRPY